MTKEPDYIVANRRAYDLLAPEYQQRAKADRIKDKTIIAPLADYLREQFGAGARILDIGPGNGVNLAMLHDLGFRMAGVDISPQMLELAKRFCPTADLRLGDFLTSAYSPSSFEGVFSKASIHLFPKEAALRVIRKVHTLLVPGGMFYVTTTASSDTGEGYSEKSDYPNHAVRYRKLWTATELLEAVTRSGFTVWKSSHNIETDWNKHWFNAWAIKQRTG